MGADGEIKGTLYGVGLGSGDPELLTLKAHRILMNADVVLVPKGKKCGDSVARDILERALGDSLNCQELVFPMERDKKTLEEHWQNAARAAVDLLNQGKDVAFVTLGDATLYSTFAYLCRSIAKMGDYSIETIPGITSVQAAAAQLNRPLALGSSTYGIISLPENLEDLDAFLSLHDTLVVMKIGGRLSEFRHFLKTRNLESKTGFARRLGLEGEQWYSSMSHVPQKAEGYLSLAIIGEPA